jgi:hypothetical protein
MCLMVDGIASCEAAEWRRGLAGCDEATAALRLCAGVRWEQVTAHVFALFSLFNLGDWQEYGRRSRALVEDARQRGDLYAQTSLALMSYMTDLAADDSTAAANRTIEDAARWPSSTFDVQQFWQSYALCEIELYRGDGLTAYSRLREFWPALRHSLLTRVHVLHVFALYLRGRCATAAAAEGERSALAVARDAARRIDRQRAPWARPFSVIIRAGVAGVEGHGDVRAHLESARIGLVVSEMQPWLTAVSYYLSRDQRGETPAPSVAWFEAQAVRRPDRFSAMLVPGIR